MQSGYEVWDHGELFRYQGVSKEWRFGEIPIALSSWFRNISAPIYSFLQLGPVARGFVIKWGLRQLYSEGSNRFYVADWL